MDENVIAAMARWPDVPDVFGWLSLSEQGQWRLHPSGQALAFRQPLSSAPDTRAAPPDDKGEPISSTQILKFIGRNYASDMYGQWFFQNGPQRVFVRLDAAPYILHTTGSGLAMQTHNGLDVNEIAAWWLDDAGRLYAQTEHGPGLIAGRDLMTILSLLRTHDGQDLLAFLERSPMPPSVTVQSAGRYDTAADMADQSRKPPDPAFRPILLKTCAAPAIPDLLGFVRYPKSRIAGT